MSTSETDVTCAAVSIEARMLRAIILRTVPSWEVSSTPHELAPLAAAGTGAGAGAGGAGAGAAAAGGATTGAGAATGGAAGAEPSRPSRNCSTSFLVTRPPRPVPGICVMSRPCSETMRATTGDMKLRASPSPFESESSSVVVSAAGGVGAAGAGATSLTGAGSGAGAGAAGAGAGGAACGGAGASPCSRHPR